MRVSWADEEGEMRSNQNKEQNGQRRNERQRRVRFFSPHSFLSGQVLIRECESEK